MSLDFSHDKRLVKHHLRIGLFEETEYEQHLEQLPDLFEEAVPFQTALDDLNRRYPKMEVPK